jgi:hypothetical protein
VNSGSSAFIRSAGQSAEASRISRPASKSRPSRIGTSMPVCRNTRTFTSGAHFSSALSAFSLSGTARPPRTPPSAVTMSFAWASFTRSARLSGEKPPNTTEWTAPIRAQASMA